MRIDERLVDYINKIVRRTREWPQFHMGASPRAGIALMQAARTLAAFSGRDYAVPDDVVQIALPALRHRVALTAEAEVEGQKVDDLLTELIRSVEVPRLWRSAIGGSGRSTRGFRGDCLVETYSPCNLPGAIE